MTSSVAHMRKTNGRPRLVAGSQVRSAAVETFVICTTPLASASSAIASDSSLEFEPTMARAPARGGERRGLARVDEVAAGRGTRRGAADGRGRRPRGSGPRRRGGRRAATAGRRRRSGRSSGRRRRWPGLPRPGSRRGRATGGIDRSAATAAGPLRPRARQARSRASRRRGAGGGPRRHRGSVHARARPSEEAELALAPSHGGARAARTAIQPVPSGAARRDADAARSRRARAPPRRPGSASSGWLFFCDRCASTTRRQRAAEPLLEQAAHVAVREVSERARGSAP